MTERIVPVIMAGGKGTRLWPLSRSGAPKQFIQFIGTRTLFQETLLRVSDPTMYAPPIVLTNSEFRFMAAEQAREIGISLSRVMLEPQARNTGPAVAAAALAARQSFGENAILHVLGSDYEIEADETYFECVRIAKNSALAAHLVTFGIEPSEPATGYGYIEAGEPLATGARKAKRFVEKPVLDTAVQMLKSGNFFWNSGMFMFRIKTLVDELQILAPEILVCAQSALDNAEFDMDFLRLHEPSFSESPNISIDYAVMEKTNIAAVVPSPFKWSDLGSWDSVWKTGARDGNGNVAATNTTLIDTSNSLAMTHGIHVAIQGMEGIAVIASEDAVYVGRLDESQSVGSMVKALAELPATRGLTECHPTTYRPWGGYTSVLNGERFQVKRIFVAPGKQLSLQKHHHRSEHWVIVKGTAEVTVGEAVQLLSENQSVYIPAGELHRLANPGKIPLELIEVQTGSYLGEDDIVRLADQYGRPVNKSGEILSN